MALARRPDERRRTVLVGSVDFRSVREEGVHDVRVSSAGRPRQARHVVLRIDCHILNKYLVRFDRLKNILTSPLRLTFAPFSNRTTAEVLWPL